MEYLGRINKGEVSILHVLTGQVFHSWQSAIEFDTQWYGFDTQPQPAPPQRPSK